MQLASPAAARGAAPTVLKRPDVIVLVTVRRRPACGDVTARLGGGALVATPSTLRRRGDVRRHRRHRCDAIDAHVVKWTPRRTVTTSMNVIPSTHRANAAPAAPPPSARTCARSGLIAISRPAPSTVGRTTIFNAKTIETLAAAAAASNARSARRKALTGSCALKAEGALRNNSLPKQATIPRAAYPSATRRTCTSWP